MAVQLGATLVDGFEVSSIREEGGVVTVTGADNTAYSAPSLGAALVPMLHASYNVLLTVLCPGPWANDILAKIGVKLPLQPWKIPVYYWKVKVRRYRQHCLMC